MKSKLELYKKLHAVRSGMHSIAYDSINSFEKFAYASSPMVLRDIRKLLNENRLVMETDMENYKATLRDDGKTIFTECGFIYRFVCIDSGAYTECRFVGQGIGKSTEKGVGKAATYSEKYFLLKYFNLPTHKADDPDFKRETDTKPTELHKTKTMYKKDPPPTTTSNSQVKNNISPETPPQDQAKPPAEDENRYAKEVFSFFDESKKADVAKFASESAKKQGVDVERLFESASKRKGDFVKAFELWLSKK